MYLASILGFDSWPLHFQEPILDTYIFLSPNSMIWYCSQGSSGFYTGKLSVIALAVCQKLKWLIHLLLKAYGD